MNLTEEEAKTKRCQESFGDRNVTTGGYVISSHSSTIYSEVSSMAIATSPMMCIASVCMAWRWGGWQADGDKGEKYIFSDPNNTGLPSVHVGYCGKAGRP